MPCPCRQSRYAELERVRLEVDSRRRTMAGLTHTGGVGGGGVGRGGGDGWSSGASSGSLGAELCCAAFAPRVRHRRRRRHCGRRVDALKERLSRQGASSKREAELGASIKRHQHKQSKLDGERGAGRGWRAGGTPWRARRGKLS